MGISIRSDLNGRNFLKKSECLCVLMYLAQSLDYFSYHSLMITTVSFLKEGLNNILKASGTIAVKSKIELRLAAVQDDKSAQ